MVPKFVDDLWETQLCHPTDRTPNGTTVASMPITFAQVPQKKIQRRVRVAQAKSLILLRDLIDCQPKVIGIKTTDAGNN